MKFQLKFWHNALNTTVMQIYVLLKKNSSQNSWFTTPTYFAHIVKVIVVVAITKVDSLYYYSYKQE